jgi:hypothetical protein
MTNLRSRFENFMSIIPSVEVIDDIELCTESRKEEKADYLGLGRRIIFEQKALETDQIDKIQSKIDKYQDEEFYPLFYGKRDINDILKYFPDEEKIKLEIYNLITKQIEGIFSKANKQIPSTEKIFNLDSSTGVLVLLNDTVNVLAPEVIAKRVSGRLGEKDKSGKYRFDRIQYVIFISETHKYKGEIPLILVIEGPTAPQNNKSINDYFEYLIYSWGHYNGGGVVHVGAEDLKWEDFKETSQAKPPPNTRSEVRMAWYSQTRYMSKLSDEEVIQHGAKLIETITPYVMKSGPSLPKEQLGELFLQFGDFMEEANLRGLDLKEMKKYHKI